MRKLQKYKTTCIITSYNYANYIEDAINSTQNQSSPFDEVIIIDDNSTDNTINVIEKYVSDPKIHIIQQKSNKGQLAAFTQGIMASSGDIIYFLDADDVYHPEYLHQSLEVYDQHPQCDFLFCNYKIFNSEILFESKKNSSKPINIGISLIKTLVNENFIGNPTSCISIKKNIILKFMPFTDSINEEWRIRADDCLVFGASLVGAHKFHLNEEFIGYRIHGNNNYANKKQNEDNDKFYVRQLYINRLFEFILSKTGLSSNIKKLAYLEFKTIDRPKIKDFQDYALIVLKNGSHRITRTKALAIMLKHFLKKLNNH